ncbi:MAG: hypothetical protein AAFN30_09895 [Actinomycetota bacterium]
MLVAVWIVVTLVAAVMQIARTSEQHRLKPLLGVAEAGYVRFAFAWPLAVVITTAWMLGPGHLPTLGARFWWSIVVGGVAQIVGTMALLQSFRLRDFAVGTIYAKTEVLFVGVASTVVLGEAVAPLGWVGAVLVLAGVAVLASGGRLRHQLSAGLDPAAWFGMAAALGFAGAAVGIRSAATSLEGTAVDRSMITLACMLGVQTLVQGVALGWSSTSSLRRVAAAWRPALLVAALSLAGSAMWALAMTLENAAKVRTLGQIEILLAFAVGAVVHHEAHRRIEYGAAALTAVGITLLVVS